MFGRYSKFIVAAAGAAETGLQAFAGAGTHSWVTVVTGVISAVLVYLVPNAPASAPASTPAPPAQ